jgi:hypothetical protein
MTLFKGTPHDVEKETTILLNTLAPFGGIIVGDGYNVAPDSPLENLGSIRKACEQYGVPPPVAR